MRHSSRALLVLSLLVGCPESDPDTNDDGGSLRPDAGEALDSGVPDSINAGGSSSDASPSTLGDARAAYDASTSYDASAAYDASTSYDASTQAPDAATGDAASNTVTPDGKCQPGNGGLMGGSRRFGLCANECSFELGFVYPVMPLADRCSVPQVNLTVGSNTGSTSRQVHAKLSIDAWQRAVDIGLALQTAELKTTYGCPDCADGGSATIVRDTAKKGLEDATYEFRNPPPVLASADAFVQSLIDQMLTCQGDDIVDCEAP